MVNSDLRELLIFGTPALASAAVVGAAWWAKSLRAAPRAGTAAANSVARPAVQRLVPGALVVLISVAIAILAYVGHAFDVSSARALHGAVIAVLASAVALGIYWALGIVIRHLVTLFGVWVLSLMPLYLYALFAWLMVAGYTQCGPQAYECPI